MVFTISYKNTMLTFFSAKKIKISLFISLIAFLCFFYIIKIFSEVNFKIASEDGITVIGEENLAGGYPIGEIFGNMQVSQSFTSHKDNLKGFSLRFATYVRTNYCTMRVDLVDTNDGKIVFSDIIHGETLTDNTFNDFTFNAICNSKDHIYNIVVSAVETSPKNAVTMYLSPCDSYPDGIFAINGVPCEGDTAFKIYYEDSSLIIYKHISNILFILLLFFAALNLFFNIEKLIKKHKRIVYTIISGILIFLLSSAVIMKPNADRTDMSMTLNFKGLIILLCFIFIAAILEKKMFYFKWIKSVLYQKIQYSRTLNSFAKLLIYVSANLANILLIVFIIFLGSFGWTKSCGIGAFYLGLAALIMNIINHIFVMKTKAPQIFLSASLIIGFVVSYCFPATTFINYDDVIHYENAAIVRNILFDRNFTKADCAMTASSYKADEFIENTKDIINKVISDDNTEQLYFANINNPYSYISYVPTAAVMASADFVGLDFFGMTFLARYVNSILFSIVIFYALKRLKSGAYILAAINLMPQMQFISAQFTYDFWVNSFIQYAIVYLISEMQSPQHKVSHVDCAKMIGAIVLGCGPKAIYCILLILFIFIDKNKFSIYKSCLKFRIMCIIAMGIILSSFILPFITDTASSSDLRGGADINSALQLNYILSNPMEYATILTTYMADFLSLDTFLTWIGMLGYTGSAEQICTTVCALIIAFNMFTDKSCKDAFNGNQKFRITLLIIFLIQVALICTALYISYTGVASDTISGVQYRYNYPVLFMFMYAMGSPRISNHTDGQINKVVTFVGMPIMSMFSIYTVYITRLLLKS